MSSDEEFVCSLRRNNDSDWRSDISDGDDDDDDPPIKRTHRRLKLRSNSPKKGVTTQWTSPPPPPPPILDGALREELQNIYNRHMITNIEAQGKELVVVIDEWVGAIADFPIDKAISVLPQLTAKVVAFADTCLQGQDKLQAVEKALLDTDIHPVSPVRHGKRKRTPPTFGSPQVRLINMARNALCD